MEEIRKYAAPLGRLLVSVVFLISGATKILGWSGTAAYMAAKGMPLVPLFLAGAIVVELGGGLAVLLGLRARLGAFALFLYLIPTTLIFHNFWAATGPARQMEFIHFLTNLAIMGGLLVLVARGPGVWSVSGGRERF